MPSSSTPSSPSSPGSTASAGPASAGSGFEGSARPAGSAAGLFARIRRHAGRYAVVLAVLCLLIALLLTALEGQGFGVKAVYSFSIGIACLLCVNLSRLASAALHDLVRRRRGLAPDTGVPGGWSGVAAGVVLAMLVGPSLGLTVADALTGSSSPSMLDFGRTSTRLTMALALMGSVGAVVVISLQERLAAARAATEAAERQGTAARLALLQSQLEPHMLFNTLANLRVLIGIDPPRAQQMLDRLIAFLRTTLAASQQRSHPLAREFAWADDYLALMRVRMGDRLAVRVDLPAALAPLPVPPLLLQPLVENAVRHGVEPRLGPCRIEVSAARDGDVLRLSVRDIGVGLDSAAGPRPGGGFGLRHVRERLHTLYGGSASLTLEEAAGEEGGTLATLRLPIAAPAAQTRPADEAASR